MRILYITPLYSGTENIIHKNNEDFTGLPPFVKTIQKLRTAGHKIDFIILGQQMKNNLNEQETEEIYYIDWNKKNPMNLFILIKKIRELIKSNEYDFVYGHGSIGVISSIISNIYKVPSGQRLYGVYPILKNIQKNRSKLSLLLVQPLYYLSFKIKKNFLLITNDGTKGDLVNKKINDNHSPNYKFYCWTNGVDELNYTEAMPNIDENFIFYPGRISNQKQQIKGLEVVEELKNRNINIKFYFAGKMDSDYSDLVLQKVNEKELNDQVVFLGAASREEMAFLYKESLATVLQIGRAHV